MANDKPETVWTAAHVKTLAPDPASIPAAQKVLTKGGFGTVEPTADGRGWWVVCRGLTDTYQVSVRRREDLKGMFDCECTCPSPKYPCKHTLALLLYLVEHPELRTEAEAPKPAASDFEALLRAVFANPDDDTPRLVFADFLEENDQADRAALIRLHCERERLKPQAKRFRELTKQLAPLAAMFQKQIEPLPEGLGYEFRRGFLRLEGDFSYLGDAGSLPARFTNLFRDGWVETVAMHFYAFGGLGGAGTASLLTQIGELDVSKYPIHEAAMVALVADTAEARAAGRLSRVVVHKSNRHELDQLVKAQQGETIDAAGDLGPERTRYGLTPAVFDLLLRAGRLSGARGLSLSGGLGDAQLIALLTADLSELRRLSLGHWDLTRTGMQALANSPKLSRLTELALTECEIGGVTALAAATGLGALETLRLPECELTDTDAEALAASKRFPKLTHLDPRMNRGITLRGAKALAASKHFPKLSALDLHDVSIDPADELPLLLDAPDRPHLAIEFLQIRASRAIQGKEVIVEIEASGNDYDELFDGLAACPGAKRVTQFSAPRLHVGAAQVAALAAGLDAGTLWLLDLTDNPLRNDGAAAVATAFAEFELLELNLRACRIQSAGVSALMNSPLMATVLTLDLSGNGLGKAGVAALLKATLPALKELILNECRLSDGEKKQLKAKFGTKLKV